MDVLSKLFIEDSVHFISRYLELIPHEGRSALRAQDTDLVRSELVPPRPPEGWGRSVGVGERSEP